MSKQLTIVLHGKCATDEQVRAAVTAIREAGHDVAVRVTWEAGDAERLTCEAIDAGCDVVVAGGGDGTINAVLHGMLTVDDARRPAMGILPLGTANDFARSAEVPLASEAALRLILDTPPTRVDVAWLNDRTFLNVATAGMGVQVTTQTPEPLKKAIGSAAYFVTGMARFNTLQPVPVTVRNDDFQWSGDILLIAIGNGRQAGGGNLLCHDAMLNDGKIDIAIMPATGEGDFTQAISAIMNGGLPNDHTIIRQQVRELHIHAPQGLHINLDGEPMEGESFDLRLDADAIKLHLPPSCPLLK